MASVLGVAYGSSLTAPLAAGTAIAGDIIVVLTVTNANTPLVPSGMGGCGATWVNVHSSARTTVWVGSNPGTIGTVTAVGGPPTGIGAWWLRGASTQTYTSWIDSPTGSTVAAEATTVGTAQAILALAHASDSMPGVGALPSTASWNGASSTSLKRAHATPSTPAVYQATTTRAGARSVLLQVVAGTPPPSVPVLPVSTPDYDSIVLGWSPPAGGSTPEGYTVKVNTDPPVDVGDDTSYLAVGLAPETEHTFEVRAYNVGGTSAPLVWTAFTEAPPDPLEPISWDDPADRYYVTGLDRGVLYPKTDNPVPWNGLKGLDEVGNGTKTIMYRDGQIFYADVEPGDFEGSLSAFFYPDAFAACAGLPSVANGLYVDNQKPQQFGLSYRTLIGSGQIGDVFGYQIHLVYQATAVIGTRARRTMTNTPDLMEFTFDLVAVPVKLPGMRPSAHYIIDTRFLDEGTLTQLEGILYGTTEVVGRLPDPNELFDTMHFGSAITFVDHGDGTWTASGSAANLIDNGDGTWQILNVNGTDHGDETFTLEDTP